MAPGIQQNLYIALFARTATPRTYHWALLVCAANLPSTPTTGVRYHVTNTIQALNTSNGTQSVGQTARIPWRFETQLMATLFTASPLLGRVLVAPIVGDLDLISAVLEAVLLVQDDSDWTCRTWVRDALAVLAQQGLIALPAAIPDPQVVNMTSNGTDRVTLGDTAWNIIEGACKAYLERKHEVGRWRVAARGRWVEGEVPTWDFGEGEEIVP